MATLTLLLLAGTMSGGLCLGVTTATPPQQEVTYTSTRESTTSYCQWSTLSNQLQRTLGTGGCIHMLSSISHCVWSMRSEGADVCPTRGLSCVNVTEGSVVPPRTQEQLPSGVWKNLVGLLKQEMSRGAEQRTRTFEYRRACVSAEGGSLAVACVVQEMTDSMSIREPNKTIFLRPESSQWAVKFSLELDGCSNGGVLRGVSFLSDKDVRATNSSREWVQIDLTYSRSSDHHVYSVTIPGREHEYNLSGSQCRGFDGYKVEAKNAALWSEKCGGRRMSTAVTTTTITTIHPTFILLYISAAAT